MQQKDQLFELIRSLTPHEKGYIRRMASLHQKGEENNYIRLFDAIDRQEQYDEAALRKKLAKVKFAENFAGAKNYLLNTILRHLESYTSTPQNEVRSLLSQYIILQRKGLLALGYKLLRRAWQICEKNELNYQKPEVLSILFGHIIHFGGKPEWPGGTASLLKLIQASSALNADALEMRFEMDQLNRTTLGVTRVRTAEEAAMLREKARRWQQYDTSRLKSFDTRYQYYQLLINYFFKCGDAQEGFRYTRELCDMLLQNWTYAGTRSGAYVTAFYNKAMYEIVLHEPGLQDSIAALERLLEKEKLGNPDSMLLLLRLKTIEAWEMCRYEETISHATATIAFIRQNEAFVNRPIDELIAHTLSACAYFALEQLPAAAKELHALLRNPAEKNAPSLGSGARIMLLIIEFERNDRLGLESQLRATFRYLLKKKQLYKVEKCVLDFLRLALRKNYDTKEMTADFKRLLENVETALLDKNEEAGMFDLVSYLESKINGESFAERRKKNVSKRWNKSV